MTGIIFLAIILIPIAFAIGFVMGYTEKVD